MTNADRIRNMTDEEFAKLWIPVEWRTIDKLDISTGEIKKIIVTDCEMPDDGQRIIICLDDSMKGHEKVQFDICYCDGEYSLDSGYEWMDIVAWMPLPPVYEGK